ncbi:hypothetical protein [Curtobacterium sp. Leaf261]|uniref:hypothetical protein n=1 Tax=Curtobacterium sp. Leaf261 TaxID=1736311 RepID=UPI0012E2BB0D|nr:hypothetical protein [Curtobacterium sp. Leaf261]
MSNLSEEQLRRSVRRAARNTVIFGAAFVIFGAAIVIGRWGHLGEPLSHRPVPPAILAGIMLVCGLGLVVQGVVRWRRVKRNGRD